MAYTHPRHTMSDAEFDAALADLARLEDVDPSTTTRRTDRLANEAQMRSHNAPTTASSLSAAPPAPSAADAKYGFPAAGLQKAPPSGDLHESLRVVTAKRAVPYTAIRQEYCELSIWMNHQNLRPPAFRSMKKRPPRAKGPLFELLTRDNMIIDLHWLHATGLRKPIDDTEFRDLLNEDEFNFDAAEQYVQKEWKTEIRILRLGITDVDQWQLSTLRRLEIRDTLKHLEAKRYELTTRFRSLIQRGARLLPEHADDFADLWLAAQLAAGHSQALLAQVHGWYRGMQPLAPPTITQKLRRMREWVAKAGV